MAGNGSAAVLGVAKLGERLVLLLDLDAALVGATIDPQAPWEIAAPGKTPIAKLGK